MEKFAVDIDKVLDEFEETEALRSSKDIQSDHEKKPHLTCFEDKPVYEYTEENGSKEFFVATNNSSVSIDTSLFHRKSLNSPKRSLVSTDISTNQEALHSINSIQYNSVLKPANIPSSQESAVTFNVDNIVKVSSSEYIQSSLSFACSAVQLTADDLSSITEENFRVEENTSGLTNAGEFPDRASQLCNLVTEVTNISAPVADIHYKAFSETLDSENELILKNKDKVVNFELSNNNELEFIHMNSSEILSKPDFLPKITQIKSNLDDTEKNETNLTSRKIISNSMLFDENVPSFSNDNHSCQLAVSVSKKEVLEQPHSNCQNMELKEEHYSPKGEEVANNVIPLDDSQNSDSMHSNNANTLNPVVISPSVSYNSEIAPNSGQDDDSGVSSQEDISGNSPEVLDNESSVIIDNKQDFSVSDEPKIDNCLDFKISTEVSKINYEDPQQDADFSFTDHFLEVDDHEAFSKITDGAKHKVSHVSDSDQKINKSLCAIDQITVGECLKSDSSISDKLDFHDKELKYNSNVNITSDIEVSLYSSNEANYSDLENMNVNEEFSHNITLNDQNLNTMSLCDLEDSKNASFPRLQRPTTLDLPSMQNATSQVLSDTESTQNPTENELLIEKRDSEEMTSVEEQLLTGLHFSSEQTQIGIVKPYWIPDSEASSCMHCGMKFTVIKRRHHCRACGKVLCSRCCNQRAHLSYLNKEDRICHPCFELLASTSPSSRSSSHDVLTPNSCGSSPSFSPVQSENKSTWRPHPNNPDDYCSTVPPLQQMQLSESRPPPTVMVPTGVLKRGNKPRKEPKQVIFSDGIRPGGDLTDLTEAVENLPLYRRLNRKRVEKILSGEIKAESPPYLVSNQRKWQKRVFICDKEGKLPPLSLKSDSNIDDKSDWTQVLELIEDPEQMPVSFALLKNLHIFVKINKLDCCFGSECWCFSSCGLCSVGQDEVMVLLERKPGETTIPRDIFSLFLQVYDNASKGCTFEDLGHIIFPDQILGNSDHRGYLFVRPTFQCLSKLVVPSPPYLVAILIHKWEVPWAKVFPLRLMLRLGAECRYYPCALVSIRNRKPVFFEIKQTIISVLADLRNYQFTLPVVPGLVVHMEDKNTYVNIPRNRYDKVMKVLNNNNVEHVLALGSNFSTEADSHLVCTQKEEGEYQTQAINIENISRKVTGASFIVFSGALKSSSGLSAKFSIVEDGLLIQIPQETMVALHMALRDMKDLTIHCGEINAADPEESVIIRWTRDDKRFNIGVRSPIDGRSLEGIPSSRIHTSTDYAGEKYLIRWTEVFFLETNKSFSILRNESCDPCRLSENLAQSCCMALAPYLDSLAEVELLKLGLRVSTDAEKDKVEYEIGSCGKPLPALYMNTLDNCLIPVILRLSSSTLSGKFSFELIFHILVK